MVNPLHRYSSRFICILISICFFIAIAGMTGFFLGRTSSPRLLPSKVVSPSNGSSDATLAPLRDFAPNSPIRTKNRLLQLYAPNGMAVLSLGYSDPQKRSGDMLWLSDDAGRTVREVLSTGADVGIITPPDTRAFSRDSRYAYVIVTPPFASVSAPKGFYPFIFAADGHRFRNGKNYLSLFDIGVPRPASDADLAVDYIEWDTGRDDAKADILYVGTSSGNYGVVDKTRSSSLLYAINVNDERIISRRER